MPSRCGHLLAAQIPSNRLRICLRIGFDTCLKSAGLRVVQTNQRPCLRAKQEEIRNSDHTDTSHVSHWRRRARGEPFEGSGTPVFEFLSSKAFLIALTGPAIAVVGLRNATAPRSLADHTDTRVRGPHWPPVFLILGSIPISENFRASERPNRSRSTR